MSQAAKCDLFLYADYSCLACRHKVLNKIEKQLNEVSVIYVIGFWIAS